MQLSTLDWSIIGLYFLATLFIGLWISKRSGKDSSEYFLGGRSLGWGLLGISLVATTFSADTPNLVTDIVRRNGVAGNWAWWAFCLTGMLTVFVYAKLWRRSGITTDLEFYELRYSGWQAQFLRGFRAIYLGVFFNVMIMATVLLAGIKIAFIMIGLSPVETVMYVGIITLVYSVVGGYLGVIYTDFFQFVLAMIGMVVASIYIVNLPEVGGLSTLLSHPNVSGKLSFLPDFSDMNVAIPLFIIPIAVQWWSVWYPGAEPGGGGYVAQRMLSAKDEKNAVIATLLFNVTHYAIRPWPWILIALASLVLFPNVSDISTKFPGLDPSYLKDDLAFSAALTYLPSGLLGLVIAALIAALMSTISTHLNWGSSYVVNDFYKRFVNKEATEAQMVNVGRISTVILMVLAALFALGLQSAMDSFNILLSIGAGTGLIFILRWFWWRINAMSEIVAMLVSFIVSLLIHYKVILSSAPDHSKLIWSVIITTIAWLIAALVTEPTDRSTLVNFYKTIRPNATGWKPIVDDAINKGAITPDQIGRGRLTNEILLMLLGCVGVYSLLFGMGYLLYGQMTNTIICTVVALVTAISMKSLWARTVE